MIGMKINLLLHKTRIDTNHIKGMVTQFLVILNIVVGNAVDLRRGHDVDGFPVFPGHFFVNRVRDAHPRASIDARAKPGPYPRIIESPVVHVGVHPGGGGGVAVSRNVAPVVDAPPTLHVDAIARVVVLVVVLVVVVVGIPRRVELRVRGCVRGRHAEATGVAVAPSRNEAQPVPRGPVVVRVVRVCELPTVQSTAVMVLICRLLVLMVDEMIAAKGGVARRVAPRRVRCVRSPMVLG